MPAIMMKVLQVWSVIEDAIEMWGSSEVYSDSAGSLH